MCNWHFCSVVKRVIDLSFDKIADWVWYSHGDILKLISEKNQNCTNDIESVKVMTWHCLYEWVDETMNESETRDR